MVLEKTKLFEQARGRWPLTVRVFPKHGTPCFEAKPCLGDVYRDIETSCEPVGDWTAEDEWTKLANWSFHQALWALAEGAGERLLHRNEVTFMMFDECMRENLTDDCWGAERIQYEESPSRFH